LILTTISSSQINRAGAILKGRLAQLLTEGTSPNPRWLIKFDGQPQKDEEMYERSFGKLISANDEEDSPSPLTVQQRKTSSSKPIGGGRRGSVGKNSGTSSEDGEVTGDEPKKGKSSSSKKTVQFTKGSNDGDDGSDDSSTPETAAARKSRVDRASAREERSRRRQAKIDEEIPIGPGEVVGGKRRPPPPPLSKNKRQRTEEDGEVVKVKLLTGTLYLYRGRQRRAEFIRRV
jgi:hypothetical protein